MKILFCIKNLSSFGGMEQVTIVKANALSEIEGNQVYICYTDKGNYPDQIIRPLSPKVKTFDLGTPFGSIAPLSIKRLLFHFPKLFYNCYRSLKQIILEIKPDIIISTGGIEKYPLAAISLNTSKLTGGGGDL